MVENSDKKSENYLCELLIDDLKFVVDKTHINRSKDENHEYFPLNPFENELYVELKNHPDIYKINGWMAEGAEEKTIELHFFHEDELIITYKIFRAICEDYKEYYSPEQKEILFCFTVRPDNMHSNYLTMPFLNKLLDKEEQPDK